MIFKILEHLGIATAGYDRLILHFAGIKNPASLWIAAALILLFAATAYFMVKPLSGLRRKILILVLHFLALVLALSVFLEPELRLAKTQKLKSPIAILIDSSESMGVKASRDQTRIGSALSWLSRNRSYFDSLKTDYELRWFSFDEKPKPLPAGFPDQPELKAEGAQTQILESLTRLRSEIGNKPLSGVVIISDGADQGALSRLAFAENPKAKGKAEKELKKNLEGLGKIYPVLVGSDQEMKDLAIVGIQHDGYGFVKNPFVVVVKVRSLGKISEQAPIQLFQEDQLIASKSVNLEPGKEQTIELEFIPGQVGRFLFRVEAPVFPDEVSSENNHKVFPLTILRDRIRVLYIVGNPSWDEKFLRRTLEKNPAVDLVSFYILREVYDDPRAPDQELALIPFPTQELFQKELFNFDLVIFQNFFGNVYMSPAYIRNLRNYVVEQGGAFIYIGGPRAFLKDSFNDPLEEILPVEFSFAGLSYQTDKLSLRLTDSGQKHPITNLAGGEMENKSLWEGIKVLENYNQVLRPKPDGVVLVEHGQGNVSPLIAVREIGKGRVLMIATDSLWKWRFEQEGRQGVSRYCQLFWERALRWLMRDPEMKSVSLSAFRERYQPGEEINLYFQVQDRSYHPISGASVSLNEIQAPEGCAGKPVAGEEISPGKYQFKLSPKCPGGYRFQARAEKDGEMVGSDEAILALEKESREMEDLSLRPELMELLAQAGKGKMLKTSQAPDKLKFPGLTLEEIIGAKDFPLWNNWLCFALLTLVFGVLWALRRYYSLS